MCKIHLKKLAKVGKVVKAGKPEGGLTVGLDIFPEVELLAFSSVIAIVVITALSPYPIQPGEGIKQLRLLLAAPVPLIDHREYCGFETIYKVDDVFTGGWVNGVLMEIEEGFLW